MIDVANLATFMRSQVASNRNQLLSLLQRLWDQYARTLDIATFANLAANLSLAAQAQVWQTTQVALKLYADTHSKLTLEDLVTVDMPAGGCREMDPYREWRWPQARAIQLLKETGDPELALASGRNVLTQLAHTDVQLAHINAAVIYFQLDPRVNGYKRAIAGTCDFCEQHQLMYGPHLVMPLHPYCECSVEPSFSSFSVGRLPRSDNWTDVLVTTPKTTTEGRPTRVQPQKTTEPIPNEIVIGAATFADLAGDNSDDATG